MAEIHVLDSETIDKIAAGEVVERPSSVVKELVENAIDAHATAITVEIKDGGIEFVRVTDNGIGMEKSQIRKAFLRHATSKIESAEDLSGISSLGFRGEALSSIAAVSKVEVITKTADSLTGTRILLEGGKEVAFDEIGAPTGTTFIMRNIFFNTPVRRKFLKQTATEGSYIADLLEHLALSRPDISFKLVQGSQTRFQTSGNGDLREVIYRLYGRECSEALVPVNISKDGFTVTGFLGKPVQVRSNRNQEICFINGRFIRSGVICKAIEEGYKEYLMQHKFPFCVLHIQMDPYRVDVNVHPTKMDVRFSQPRAFSEFLCNAVRDTLQKREMIPEASLATDKEIKAARKQEMAQQRKASAPEPFELNRTGRQTVVKEDIKFDTPAAPKSDIKQSPVWTRIQSAKSEDTQGIDTPKYIPPLSQKSIKASEDDFFTETVDASLAKDDSMKTSDIPKTETKAEEKSAATTSVTDIESDSKPINETETIKTGTEEPLQTETEELVAVLPEVVPEQMDLFAEKILTDTNRKKFRLIGQVFDTYWLIEFENKLLMIDQHAAHEKVNYERLMKQFREKNVISQRLLPPIVVTLSAKEELVLKENLEVFLSLGFDVEDFGGNEYTLRSVPVDLYGCNEKQMFIEVLDQLADGGNFGGIKVIEEKIASMSCKAAIKGNQSISAREAEVLIDELLGLENPYNCPHGRPTIVSMTKTEMEKKFKRIV